MALSLTVPTTIRNLPSDVDVNPKKAKAWVESLPLTKMIESTRALTENLEALNHAKMPCEDRVALLEIYRPTIAVLLDELEAVYSSSSLPLPPKQREAFDLASQLLVQCGYAYKMMVSEKSGKSLFSTPGKVCLCRCSGPCTTCAN